MQGKEAAEPRKGSRARQEGYELTDEELESFNGGWDDEPIPLPKCDIHTTPPIV